jgi:hypothetical protein
VGRGGGVREQTNEIASSPAPGPLTPPLDLVLFAASGHHAVGSTSLYGPRQSQRAETTGRRVQAVGENKRGHVGLAHRPPSSPSRACDVCGDFECAFLACGSSRMSPDPHVVSYVRPICGTRRRSQLGRCKSHCMSLTFWTTAEYELTSWSTEFAPILFSRLFRYTTRLISSQGASLSMVFSHSRKRVEDSIRYV